MKNRPSRFFFEFFKINQILTKINSNVFKISTNSSRSILFYWNLFRVYRWSADDPRLQSPRPSRRESQPPNIKLQHAAAKAAGLLHAAEAIQQPWQLQLQPVQLRRRLSFEKTKSVFSSWQSCPAILQGKSVFFSPITRRQSCPAILQGQSRKEINTSTVRSSKHAISTNENQPIKSSPLVQSPNSPQVPGRDDCKTASNSGNSN